MAIRSTIGRGTEVRWGTARRMAYAWALTLPAAGAVGALAALLTRLGTGGSLLVCFPVAYFITKVIGPKLKTVMTVMIIMTTNGLCVNDVMASASMPGIFA